MSQQAFVEFHETYLASPSGADTASKLNATKDRNEWASIAVAAGRAAGYEFTTEEIRTVMTASEAKLQHGELSEDQLATAVGGARASKDHGGSCTITLGRVREWKWI